MDSESSKLHFFFFPYLMGGHLIPMIDVARVFASHGVKSTIVTTAQNAILYKNTIHRDQQSGNEIAFRTIELPISDLPTGIENQMAITSVDMSMTLFSAAMNLQKRFELLLREVKPNCIVTDMFYTWTADMANEVGIPRIIFHGTSCFPQCVEHIIRLHSSHEKVSSDFELFTVPDIPDKIELTRSMLPDSMRTVNEITAFFYEIKDSEQKSYGVFINSFCELEQDYLDYYEKEMGKRVWHIGPVSFCNKKMDTVERGSETSIDEHSCLSWLDKKEPNSVLYISFGSLPRIAPEQIREIALGLEACDSPFIWVIGKFLKTTGGEPLEEQVLLPGGFEERITMSNRGLIIRGWAPQLLILQHEAVGGFMSHCGWNSVMESLSSGVPFITWPITSEQFYNEKFITNVLKIGVSVGNMEWISWMDEPKLTVGREMVTAAIKRLMGREKEERVVGIRRRVKELAEKAKKAVVKGGSSHSKIHDFIEEIKSLQKSRSE